MYAPGPIRSRESADERHDPSGWLRAVAIMVGVMVTVVVGIVVAIKVGAMGVVAVAGVGVVGGAVAVGAMVGVAVVVAVVVGLKTQAPSRGRPPPDVSEGAAYSRGEQGVQTDH